MEHIDFHFIIIQWSYIVTKNRVPTITPGLTPLERA
jgi:hypothetical protein